MRKRRREEGPTPQWGIWNNFCFRQVSFGRISLPLWSMGRKRGGEEGISTTTCTATSTLLFPVGLPRPATLFPLLSPWQCKKTTSTSSLQRQKKTSNTDVLYIPPNTAFALDFSISPSSFYFERSSFSGKILPLAVRLRWVMNGIKILFLNLPPVFLFLLF